MGNDQVPKQGFHGMSSSGGWDSKLPTPQPHHCHGGLGFVAVRATPCAWKMNIERLEGHNEVFFDRGFNHQQLGFDRILWRYNMVW